MSKQQQIVGILLIVAQVMIVQGLFDNKILTPKLTSRSQLLERISDSDHVSAAIFCRDSNSKCRQIEQIILDFAEEVEGQAKVYVIACEEIAKNPEDLKAFGLCDNQYADQLPQLTFFVPPLTDINPYTKQKMQMQQIPYQGSADVKSLIGFARKNMNAYREQLKTIEDTQRFLKDQLIPWKIVLFTQKDETPGVFKGLTAEFRDRLEFAEINAKHKELIDLFGITKFPTLLAVKTDKNGAIIEKEEYKNEQKYKLFRRWLQSFALENKVKRPEQTQQQQQQQQSSKQEKPKEIIVPVTKVNRQNYQKEVLNQDKVVIVQAKTKNNITIWNQLQQTFSNLVKFVEIDCSDEQNIAFAKEIGFKTYPSIRLYPYSKKSKETAPKSIYNEDVSLDVLKKEVSDIFEDFSASLSAQEMGIFILSSLNKGKAVILYLYNEDETDISFRAIQQQQQYTEYIDFARIKNPPKEVLDQLGGIGKLPRLIGAFVAREVTDEEPVKSEEIQVAQMTHELEYSFITGFADVFVEMKGGYASKKKIDQIKRQQDFDNFCLRRGGLCLIALLNGDQNKAKLEGQLEELKAVKDKFQQNPVNFLWIDARCHSYLLEKFQLQSEYIPTAIIYSPSRKFYSNLVGIFDKDSLRVFVDNTLRGRVQQNPFTNSIEIEEQDCVSVHQRINEVEQSQTNKEQSQADKELEDEILREILEEQRKKQEELEELEKQSKKKKKKNKKKKDEL